MLKKKYTINYFVDLAKQRERKHAENPLPHYIIWIYKTEPSGNMTEDALTVLHTVTVTGILVSTADSRVWVWINSRIIGMTGVGPSPVARPRINIQLI